VRPEELGKLKKFIHLIGSRTLDLPACSVRLNHLRYHISPADMLADPNFKCILLCPKATNGGMYHRVVNTVH
jgi:hypothetical protein